ncbi:glycosyl transferase [Acidocella aquatica]|uniref:Glycosyl transferase n=1 Tax=Acidocella aquatica TaxID=1922313 RepID=A0ABQ6A8D8_9PROT|nr:glycosyltransferase family 1 protein [Acidocella aquatica]GLR66335.1 glycosyl transferase [Acidocella aquatica]
MTGSEYSNPRTPEGEIWLDISRLLYRVFRGKITGIDRVEIAYAEQILNAVPAQARFVAYDYWRGSFRAMPQAQARALVREIGPAWRAGDMAGVSRRSLHGLLRSIFTAPALPRYRGGARPTYINVSNHPLHLVDRVGRMTARTGAVFIPLVHDLIPLELPEYVPPAWIEHHRSRLKTIAAHADGIISNSESTTQALRMHIPRLPVATIPLGVGTLMAPPAPAPTSPYFVMVGTIEPRKNHLLLLHIWRRLVHEYGIGAPDLHIIGRRGWENEQVVDILERCSDIAGHVHEHGMVADGELASTLAGARALLMPSFAEGYGLPVVESLAMGVPVICSDIGAHREIGKGVPEFLDPLDGPAWMRMIMDYATPQSEARAAQKTRLAGWRAPAWSEHMAAVLDFAARVEPRRPARQSTWSRMMLATNVSSTQAMKPASAVSAVASQRTG